ncbi:MAG: tetratricopeptide repeat protein [Bacillota bacterium]
MDKVTLKVIRKDNDRFILRFVASDGKIARERELSLAEIESFAKEVGMDSAAEVGYCVSTELLNCGRYCEAEAVCHATLTVGDDYRILYNLARAKQALGKLDQAYGYYEQAMALFPRFDPEEEPATAKEFGGILDTFGSVLYHQGETARAIELWEQSVEIRERTGDLKGKADTLNSIATALAEQGEVARANPLGLYLVADAPVDHGKTTRAIELWEQSVKIRERIGDLKGKADTLNSMAHALVAQGETVRAMELWGQSVEIRERFGDFEGKAFLLHTMAQALVDQGEITRAMELCEQSLEIWDGIGDARRKATTLHEMAYALGLRGEIAPAMELWKKSLEIRERIGDGLGKVLMLSDMARVFADRGEIAQAMELWGQSLEIADIEEPEFKPEILKNMADAYAYHGKIALAIELWEQSLAIIKHIGDDNDRADMLSHTAFVLMSQGEMARAMEFWERALGIYRRIGDRRKETAVLKAIAELGKQNYAAKSSNPSDWWDKLE